MILASRNDHIVGEISINYYLFILVKRLHACVALKVNKQRLLNRVPALVYFPYAQQEHALRKHAITPL